MQRTDLIYSYGSTIITFSLKSKDAFLMVTFLCKVNLVAIGSSAFLMLILHHMSLANINCVPLSLSDKGPIIFLTSIHFSNNSLLPEPDAK